jgi:hypothetical protein
VKNKMKVIFFALLLSQSGSAKELFHAKSTSTQQNFVELYSSEGCSSCPPAEKWLGTLKSENGLWTKFVPVEFHVDYWDNLGWKDPYASPDFTQRQREYAELWRNGNIYTPGVVLDGKEWRSWGSGGSGELKAQGDVVGVLEVTEQSKGKFLIKFSPTSKSTADKYFVNAALLGNGLASQVLRGENSRENLHHEFVALSLKKVPLSGNKNVYSATVNLPKEEVKIKPASLSAAFWVTGLNQTPIQAVGGDLSQ